MRGDYLVLALKNLKHRGIRSWLTLLGIFIGVAAVVSLISLGNGLQAAVGAQFGISSTEMITIQAGGIGFSGPPGTGVTNKLTRGDVEAIEDLPSVEVAIARNIITGTLEYNDILQVGVAASIPEGQKRKLTYEILEINPEKGRVLKDGDNNAVFLGYNFLTEDNGFDKAMSVGDKVLLNGKSFKIVGFLEKKGSFVWDGVVMVNDGPLNDLADYGDDVDLIAVKVKDKDLMDKAKGEIEKLMRKRRGVKVGEEDFSVSTPDAILGTVNSVLGGVKAFIVVIASISILVGALGIVNTMTTSVLERKKEIGVMKAIGAKNSQVFMQFFIESGLLGFVGGLVGVIAGTLMGMAGMAGINNFLGTELPMNIDFMLVGLTLLGSFIIGSVAGIVPAMNAAKQDPVEALRG